MAYVSGANRQRNSFVKLPQLEQRWFKLPQLEQRRCFWWKAPPRCLRNGHPFLGYPICGKAFPSHIASRWNKFNWKRLWLGVSGRRSATWLCLLLTHFAAFASAKAVVSGLTFAPPGTKQEHEPSTWLQTSFIINFTSLWHLLFRGQSRVERNCTGWTAGGLKGNGRRHKGHMTAVPRYPRQKGPNESGCNRWL